MGTKPLIFLFLKCPSTPCLLEYNQLPWDCMVHLLPCFNNSA